MQEAEGTPEELEFIARLEDPDSKLTKEETEAEYIRIYKATPLPLHDYLTWSKIEREIDNKWGDPDFTNQLSWKAKQS